MSITLLSVPLFDCLPSAPGAPQALHVQADSCSSIRVSWLPPNSSLSGGLPLISYRVRYNGTELHNISRGEHKLEVDIPGLQPNTLYIISVSANNTLGWGEEAQGSNTTMTRMTANLFSAMEVKSKTITLKAMMRSKYRKLQCARSPNDKPVTFTQRRKEVAGLTPKTQYTIHCVAKNDDGSDACVEKILNVTTRKNRELLTSHDYDLEHINFILHIPNHLILFLHSTAPSQVTNVTKAADSWVVRGRIYQPIAWDKPAATEDNEVPKTYVVRYKKLSSDAVRNTTETRNNKTTLVLSLPLPQQAVTYIVSVAGKAGTEQGSFSAEITINYSSMYA